jgi:hypothetical protein
MANAAARDGKRKVDSREAIITHGKGFSSCQTL